MDKYECDLDKNLKKDPATKELGKVLNGAADIVASQEMTNLMSAYVRLIKKADELLARTKQKKSAKKVKKKKKKCRVILPVDVQFIENQKRKKNRISVYDEKCNSNELLATGDSSLCSSFSDDEGNIDSGLPTSDNDSITIKSPPLTGSATDKHPSCLDEPAIVQEDMPPWLQEPMGSTPIQKSSEFYDLFPNYFWSSEAQKSFWNAKTFFLSFNGKETLFDVMRSDYIKTSHIHSQLASQQLSSNNSYCATEPIDQVWSQKETGCGADPISEPDNLQTPFLSTSASTTDSSMKLSKHPWPSTSLEFKNDPCKYKTETSFFLPGIASDDEDLYTFFSPSDLDNEIPGAIGSEPFSLGNSYMVEESSADAYQREEKIGEAIRQLQVELDEKQNKEMNTIRICLQDRARWLKAILQVAEEQITFLTSVVKSETTEKLISDLESWLILEKNCNSLLAQTIEKLHNIRGNFKATDEFLVPHLPSGVFIVESLPSHNCPQYDLDQSSVRAKAGLTPTLTDLVDNVDVELNFINDNLIIPTFD